MADTFVPKDIESLSKLASLLAVPFFSAALFIDVGLWVLRYDNSPFLHWLISAPIQVISFLAKGVVFMCGVVAVMVIYEVANDLLRLVPKLTFFFGLTLLTFGVLGIGQLANPTPFGTVNLFWHLGSLCWGLSIFQPLPSKQ